MLSQATQSPTVEYLSTGWLQRGHPRPEKLAAAILWVCWCCAKVSLVLEIVEDELCVGKCMSSRESVCCRGFSVVDVLERQVFNKYSREGGAAASAEMLLPIGLREAATSTRPRVVELPKPDSLASRAVLLTTPSASAHSYLQNNSRLRANYCLISTPSFRPLPALIASV